MNEYLAQASHNRRLHDLIEQDYRDDFYDWKITILFYVAIHYLKAWARLKNCNIGDTHKEIAQNVSPLTRNFPGKKTISKGAWESYFNLYVCSRTSRYDGITDLDTFHKLKKKDHNFSLVYLENFRKYLKSQGLQI